MKNLSDILNKDVFDSRDILERIERQCPHFLRHSLPPQIDEIPA
jgi:hypothetical protein